MSTPILVGIGIAAAGTVSFRFALSSNTANDKTYSTNGTVFSAIILSTTDPVGTNKSQARVGIQALKRYKALGGGGASPFGKQFYKGGFESRMNRREAALILQLRWVRARCWGVCLTN
jgi:hypothetical protein